MHDAAPRSRLVAKVVRELLKAGAFPSFAELTAAVKDRLAALRIQASPDDLNAAYRAIESNRPLIEDARRPALVEVLPVVPIIGREEAAAICRRLGGVPWRAMPRAVPARGADRRRAAQLVAREILASIARSEALEAEGRVGW